MTGVIAILIGIAIAMFLNGKLAENMNKPSSYHEQEMLRKIFEKGDIDDIIESHSYQFGGTGYTKFGMLDTILDSLIFKALFWEEKNTLRYMSLKNEFESKKRDLLDKFKAVACPYCSPMATFDFMYGSGKIGDKICQDCNGTGLIEHG